jgi:hypothetical protein
MNWDYIREIIERTKATHRDILIENILKEEEVENKTSNEKFIDELKDHLSTCINKSDYYEWFIIDIQNTPHCNCKVHIEEEFALISFLHTLYSLYRTYDDFRIEYIVAPDVITKITIK